MFDKDKLDDYSLDDWEVEFGDIYDNIDRDRRPTEMWLILMENASKVAEAIRRCRCDIAMRLLPHIFSWSLGFVRRCRAQNDLCCTISKPLSDIVWNKYPRRCPKCGQDRCICPVRRWEIEEMNEQEKQKREAEIEWSLSIQRQRREDKPETLDKLTDMFGDIYREAHYNLSTDSVTLHLMEEIGEVATCLRELRERPILHTRFDIDKLRINLENEIADVVSWTMSLTSKLDFMLGLGVVYKSGRENIEGRYPTAGLRLSRIVWNAFVDKSGTYLYDPKCENRPCKCRAVSL